MKNPRMITALSLFLAGLPVLTGCTSPYYDPCGHTEVVILVPPPPPPPWIPPPPCDSGIQAAPERHEPLPKAETTRTKQPPREERNPGSRPRGDGGRIATKNGRARR